MAVLGGLSVQTEQAALAEPELALRGGARLVPRLAPSIAAISGPVRLRLATRGAISGLAIEAQAGFSDALGDDALELRRRGPRLAQDLCR